MLRIRSLPPLFFLVLVLKIIESYSDFVTSLNLSLYLTNELGYSDTDAGWLYGAWGAAVSIFGIALGSAIDSLGVRRSLLVGGVLSLIGRWALAMQASGGIGVDVSLLGFQAMGAAFSIPVMSIAIRRMVPPDMLTVAFSLFYAAMQLGAISAGFVTDGLRLALGRHPLVGLLWSTRATTFVYCVLVYRYIPATFAVPYDPAAPKSAAAGSCSAQTRATCTNPIFWRLVVFSLLLTGTSTVGRHIDLSLPKFIVRTIGDTAHYGVVYTINPVIVLFSVTLVQSATARYDPYDVIVVGTLLTAIAPLVLYAMPPAYSTFALFMVIVSAGEVLYSPRVYEFMLRLAPHGHEGVYSALASAPLFLVRLGNDALSGSLLQSYCGDTNEVNFVPHCQSLWLVVAMMAFGTTLSLLLAHRCIYTDDVRQRATYTAPRHADEDEEIGVVDVDAESLK